MKTLILIVSLATVVAFAESKSTPDMEGIRKSLYQYYNDCGFYPEKLEEILVPTSTIHCKNGGGTPPVEPYGITSEMLVNLNYKAINFSENATGIVGYQGYNLSLE